MVSSSLELARSILGELLNFFARPLVASTLRRTPKQAELAKVEQVQLSNFVMR